MIIHANVMSLIIYYAVALIVGFIVGLILRLPLLPERPIRHSWTVSIIFPTLIIALGLSAMISRLLYADLWIAILIGVLSALFSKYLLERVFPQPSGGEFLE